MDNFIYINACKTTLAEDITESQTILSVSNPGRFPSSIPLGHILVLTLHPDGLPSTQEIVHCTAISGDVLTVVRGAQSTAAVAWPEGTVVGAYLTADMLDQIADDVRGHAGSGGSAHALATTVAAGFMSAANVVKLNGIQAGATNYQHPITHSPTIIAQDANNRFTTDQERGDWNAAKNHADSAHAPSNAQKNSDITKDEIEARLTGANIVSHGHADELAALGTMFTSGVTAKSSAYTVATTDRGKLFDCTGTWTLALPAAATAGAGFAFAVRNSGTGAITVDCYGSETVDGAATITLAAGASAVIVCTGEAWLSVGLAAPIGYPISVANGGTGSSSTPTASNSPQADNIKAVKHDHGHNNVGSFCCAAVTGSTAASVNSTMAGSGLIPCSGLGLTFSSSQSGSLSGTWRCLGVSPAMTESNDPTRYSYIGTLWQRIS